jgi:hypothetical protein
MCQGYDTSMDGRRKGMFCSGACLPDSMEGFL